MLKRIVLLGVLVLFFVILPSIQAQETTPLVPGMPITAEIGVTGEEDTYTFTGRTGDRVVISAQPASGSVLDTVLELYDPFNALAAKNDDASQSGGKGSEIQFTLAFDGEYRAVVSAFAGASTGEYEILLTAEGTPASTTEEGTLTFGETASGTLDTQLYDVWLFTPETDMEVQISLSSTEFDTLLEIFDNDGNFIGGDDDSGDGTNSLIFQITLEGGETYQIRANSYDNRSTGDYSLFIGGVPAAPAASQIAYGETVDGNLDRGQRLSYTFEGQAGDSVVIEVESSFDAYLELLDQEGDTLAQDDDSGGNFQPYLFNIELPRSGIYQIVVRGYDASSSGFFTLTLSEGEITAVEGDQISYGDTVEGFLPAGEDVSYQFEGSTGDVVTISATAGFDTMLQLRAGSGRLLTSDDDGGGNLNPLIEAYTLPETGAYEIVLRGFSDQSTGRYELTLELGETVGGGGTTPSTSGSSIAYGETRDGEITANNPVEFTFEGRDGDMVTIRVTSDFDTTLEVIAPDGRSFARDDDSGGNFQPLLEELQLEDDGTYTILVTGYSSFDTGTFTLSLELADAVATNPDTPPTSAGMMSYGETYEGELEPGIDAEITFTAAAGDVVSITAVSEFDGYLELNDPAGVRIATDDDGGEGFNPALQNITLTEAGTYTIVFKAFGGQGRGPFTVTLTAGETTVVEATETPEPSTDTGTGSDTPLTLPVVYGDRFLVSLAEGRVIVFTFTGSTGDEVSISAIPPGFSSGMDLFIEVYSPSGELLAVDDDSGWRVNPSIVGLALAEEGTYRVEVRSFSGLDTGDFIMALESGAVYIAPDGDLSQPLDISAAPQITMDLNQVDLYSFDAEAGDVVTFEGEGIAFEVYSAAGGTDYALEGDTFTVPASGTYLLVAYTTPNQGGTATISSALAAVPAEPITTLMGAVLPDEPVTGTLQSNETQIWTFTPLQSGAFTFALNSNDPASAYDPFLRLTGMGSIIAVDDDQGGNFNALLTDIPLEAGQPIQIEVTSFAGQIGGDYTLAVVTVSLVEVSDLEGGDLTLDEAVSATLEAAGQKAIFSFTVETPGSFSFEVEGLSLPVIDLYDEDVNLVARGTNILAAQKLEAGSYQVHIYNRLNQPGTFELTVTEDE